VRPPMVDSYRGFVFLSWRPDNVDLGTYLGHARDYLDLVADQSPHGMQIVGGTHLYSMRANWKLLVENSIDGYHALTTHQRYLEMLKASGKSSQAMFRAPAVARLTDPPVPLAARRNALDLGGGHAVIGAMDTSAGTELGGLGRALPTESARQKHLARRMQLVADHGETWTDRILGGRNLLIFPNLLIIDLVMGCTVRTLYPESVDYMEITGWQLAPVGEDEELRRLRMDNFLTFWGPAGLATPDDVEALERCQRGFAAGRAAPWSDISRGMAKAHPSGLDELQIRTFWRHWNKLITGEALPPEENAVFDPAIALRAAVEDFLFFEADLLDRWELDAWLALWTDEVTYLIPATDRPDGDPFQDLFLVQDDRFLLEQRVRSLLTKTAWAESPHSTTRRIISNVRAHHIGDGAVDARANFVVYRSRRSIVDVYPGRYELLLERGGPAGFRLRTRKAILSLEELRPHGRVSFIL
jgi:3-phenylpropionate/cinnamic acid dioxygenase small subunit/phenylpropionate dioxygenase-like ring-hydroxylating dioxygenase large terminal subunit